MSSWTSSPGIGGLLNAKQVAGRVQLIINNAGDPANIEDGEGWNSSKLYLLHFRCTAQADGHSFMLCMNHDGTVTLSESWANPAGNGLFLELQRDKVRRGRAEISNANAIAAVNRIFDESPAVRTQGYTRLSQAYGNSVLYELRGHDEHAEGHHCGDECRASDADISIVVRARQLTKPATVRNRLTELRGVYDAIG